MKKKYYIDNFVVRYVDTHAVPSEEELIEIYQNSNITLGMVGISLRMKELEDHRNNIKDYSKKMSISSILSESV